MKRLKMIKVFRETGEARDGLDTFEEGMLMGSPLLGDLPRGVFLKVVRSMTRLSLKKGELLFEEGDRGDSFFVILSGRLKIWRPRGGRRKVLDEMTAGGTLGEMAVISGMPRSASASATCATDLMELKRQPLRRLSSEHRCLGRALRRFYKSRFVEDLTRWSPLFAPLSPEEQLQIVDKLLVYNHTKGQVILKQGIHGNGLHIIMHGKVRVYRELPEGGEKDLARLGPGEMFGEISILLNQPTIAAIAAEQDTRTCYLPRKSFCGLVLDHPGLRVSLFDIAAERTARTGRILAGKESYREGAISIL